MANQPATPTVDNTSTAFSHKVWVAVGIVTAVFITLFLLGFALKELLAIFAGILLAVFLQGISNWLEERTFVSHKAALFLTIASLIVLILVVGFLLIPSLAQQSEQLGKQLQVSLGELETRFTNSDLGEIVLKQINGLQSLTGDTSSLISRASTIFSSTIDVLARGLIILFVGFYLAYEPEIYINGLLKLLPRSRRSRYHEALKKVGYTLGWWLVGRLASMAIVGVLSLIGLMLLGIPLAFILGLLTGLLAFIPLVGPALALIPPMLIAFTESLQQALYVFLLFAGIQFVESYFLTPIIQKRVTSLPPVLLIGSQVLLSLFAGVGGVALAAPLAVTGIVLVKMLYVEDILNDHSVAYLEENRKSDQRATIEKQTNPHPPQG